jgi:hypothetical protein
MEARHCGDRPEWTANEGGVMFRLFRKSQIGTSEWRATDEVADQPHDQYQRSGLTDYEWREEPNQVAEALRLGLGLPEHRDAAPAVPKIGGWEMAGPLRSGNLTILDGGGRCLATLKVDVIGIERARKVGRLMCRAPAMRDCLEHIQAELEGDDDGTRFDDLLRLIGDELALSERAD